MDIREFKQSDASKVSEIIIRNLREINSKDYSAEAIEQMCETYQPDGLIAFSKYRDIFVVEDDSIIIGTITIDKNKIYTMFVDVDLHRQGIGRKIMDFAEKTIKRKGYDEVIVPSAITAYQFYERLGYEEFRTEVYDKVGEVKLLKKRIKHRNLQS